MTPTKTTTRTTFVLVPGPFTGGWVWDEVASRLREAGAKVHAATLTGLGGQHQLADTETDLETHVDDVLRLIDEVPPQEQLVLVGHCYGIHPVLGAADRRPERIARVVYLDAGMPADGDPALKLVPDPTVHGLLAAGTGPAAVPAPDREGWQRWGSTEGVPADALDRLTRLAAPQPSGTLTRPLRMSGAAAALPTTGVLCTGNGSSIALVQNLMGLGDPRLLALAEPRVTFFELATGHWPMLSVPAELADVLLQAAAGEGHRLTAKTDEPPAHLRPFLLDVPERARERIGRVDLYLPDAGADIDGSPQQPFPAVVFVHGGPVPEGVRPTPRDWPTYAGYGSYVAELGAVGVIVDHRLHDLADYGRAAEDVAAAVALVRADPRVDEDRVALWFFSGGGLLSADWLAAPPPWLRSVAATYPILAPLPNWPLADRRFRPADTLPAAGSLPVVLTQVGLEMPEIAATVEEFRAAAKDCGADLEVIEVPGAHHGFETVDHTDETREAVRRAVRSVLGHLRG
ncbi:alpha/beta fold hydrolase [Streptomyces sp. NBC_01304]|uniref:alpha/beta fold hydrolase n=1 Tax=Streptomyces sp. NBC_01304 TaxID=2903818 RepID=UPI002E142FF1|nr:dienelactone hydrolase family protein [Streptomyces sp. NBC_01304]